MKFNMAQRGFSRLWDGYSTDKDAMKARNVILKEIKKKGISCFGFTLRNQLKKYDGIGQPNGSSCNVYMIDYDEKEKK
jgi:hypothetical protein